MLKKLIGPVIVILAIVLVMLMIRNKPRPETQPIERQPGLSLLTQTLQAKPLPMIIETEGFVTSKWRTTLTAEVTGRVISVAGQLLSGNRFQAGDVLVVIDPLPYEVQLSRARANLSNAQVQLTEEEKQAARAEKDWYRINPNREPEPFNLRVPQLNAARQNLTAAQKDVQLAEDNLLKTRITAPYDGFALSRNVDLGEAIQVGSVLGELVADGELQINASLTTSEAALIAGGAVESITLRNDSGQTWPASELRFEPFIDTENRWRTVIIDIPNDPAKPLFGEYLNIELVASHSENLLAIPETAVAIDGSIWSVEDGLSAQWFPDVVYQRNGRQYIKPINDKNSLELISSPPNSLTTGVRINNAQNSGETQ
jgi:RND family efflux transporter MFP subunit